MEERNLNYFFKNCIERKLCKEYVLLWRNCKTKKDFVDLSLQMGSIEFIAKSIYEGWGLSTDFIKKEFADFINGKYIGENIYRLGKSIEENIVKDNLKSLMYCGYNDRITFNENIIHICNCTCDLYVPFNGVKFIFITNKSKVRLYLTEDSVISIHLFDESKIFVEKDTECSVIDVCKHSNNCKIIQNETIGNYIFRTKNLDT